MASPCVDVTFGIVRNSPLSIPAPHNKFWVFSRKRCCSKPARARRGTNHHHGNGGSHRLSAGKSGDRGFRIAEAARIDHGNHFKNTYLACLTRLNFQLRLKKPLRVRLGRLWYWSPPIMRRRWHLQVIRKDMPGRLCFPPSHFLAGPVFKGYMQDETILTASTLTRTPYRRPTLGGRPPTQSGKAQVLSLGY